MEITRERMKPYPFRNFHFSPSTALFLRKCSCITTNDTKVIVAAAMLSPLRLRSTICFQVRDYYREVATHKPLRVSCLLILNYQALFIM
jgi:hypothetical protein